MVRMLRRIYVIILMVIMIANIFVLNLSVKASWSGGTITIKEDGTIEPGDAPIKRGINSYLLMSDIKVTSGSGIIVERDNIVINGDGHTLEGPGLTEYCHGIDLTARSGVKIRNIKIVNFPVGIHLDYSSGNIITNNHIEGNGHGIYIRDSSNNMITENLLKDNGIFFDKASGNTVYHNNFISTHAYSVLHAYCYKSVNTWDNGSEGNYWSDYDGSDADGDGLGGIPYVIDSENEDNYPLVEPHAAIFEVSNLSIISNSVKVGETVIISVIVKNIGSKVGSYDVMLKVNNTIVDQKTITLNAGESTTVSFSYRTESDGIHINNA